MLTSADMAVLNEAYRSSKKAQEAINTVISKVYDEDLALECSKHLNKGGCVYFEIGYDQAEAVSRILTIAGYREIEVIKDEPGLDRVVKARWNR